VKNELVKLSVEILPYTTFGLNINLLEYLW